MYLPTFSRPDGTGKQFFTLRGHFGIATDTTPTYERYFAGNFASLHSRVLLSNGQSSRLQCPDWRHHDGRGVGRIPVSLERP